MIAPVKDTLPAMTMNGFENIIGSAHDDILTGDTLAPTSSKDWQAPIPWTAAAVNGYPVLREFQCRV